MELLRPYPSAEMVSYPVSTLVNNTNNAGAGLLMPLKIYFDCYKFPYDVAKKSEQTLKHELIREEFDDMNLSSPLIGTARERVYWPANLFTST